MKERSIAIRAIIAVDNQLLVEWLPERNVCFPPGGRVEEGENHDETLRRELAEELGLSGAIEFSYLGRILTRWREGAAVQEVTNHYYRVHLETLGTPAFCFEPGRHFRWLEGPSNEFCQLVPPMLTDLLPDVLAGRCLALWNAVDDELAQQAVTAPFC